MKESILLGHGDRILPLPRAQWEERLAQVPAHGKAHLSFMSATHHRIRNFVVTELPVYGQPIPPAHIAVSLNLSLWEVETIVAELERKLFFVVRNKSGAVSWAFPVTVEPTPHRIVFDSGEILYAA